MAHFGDVYVVHALGCLYVTNTSGKTIHIKITLQITCIHHHTVTLECFDPRMHIATTCEHGINANDHIGQTKQPHPILIPCVLRFSFFINVRCK